MCIRVRDALARRDALDVSDANCTLGEMSWKRISLHRSPTTTAGKSSQHPVMIQEKIMKGLIFCLLPLLFTTNAHAVDYLDARMTGIGLVVGEEVGALWGPLMNCSSARHAHTVDDFVVVLLR